MKPAREVERFDAALRWIVRKLRLMLDAADERVHSWEVLLRKESVIAATTTPGKVGQPIEIVEAKLGESLRRPRSRVGNPADHGRFRRRGVTSREFDLRFAR